MFRGSKIRWWLFTVFSLLILISTGCYADGEEDFPPAVAAAIRDALGEPESRLAQEDLEKVESLDLEGLADLVDLSSLKRLVNLRSVNLSYVNVKDYHFLYDLPKLKFLYLEGVSLADLPDFGNLQLESLHLSDSDITTLDFIDNWKGLESLSIVNSQLGTIEGIQNAQNLRTLQISYNPVQDIRLLSELGHLERIELRSTQVKDSTFAA